eukprot:3177020-Lingulodinium_polyedra.AAC.1
MACRNRCGTALFRMAWSMAARDKLSKTMPDVYITTKHWGPSLARLLYKMPSAEHATLGLPV